MKKLQGLILNIVLAASLVSCLAIQSYAVPSGNPEVTPLSPGTAAGKLGLADSLFHLKQYTQSLELYDDLFQNKFYSSSMLLKLAYIHEGLGHLGKSLYYLNLYSLATDDPKALEKIEEVAAKNKLQGYAESDATRLWILLKENYHRVLSVLIALCVFFFAWLFYQKVKLHRRPTVPAI